MAVDGAKTAACIHHKYSIKKASYKDEDLKKLQELIERQTVHCLMRFLKANLTPEDACSALIRYTEWREKYNVDSLREDDPDIIKEHAIGRVLVLEDNDHDGRPVELLSSKCNDDIIDNFCIILDLGGFSLSNMDYTHAKRIIWIMQNCYPERLGVCLIVNSPWIFYGCWSIIKLWLNEVTVSKIVFIQNKEDLADFINIDKLPKII
eukprot:gene7065-7860_t